MFSTTSNEILDVALKESGCAPGIAEKIAERVLYCYPNVTVATFKVICRSVRADKGELVRLLTSRRNADVQRGYILATKE